MQETKPLIFVSIVIPSRNEAKYISKVLENILSQDYPADLIEVIIIDGESDDNTLYNISTYKDKFKNLKILNNPAKVVPHALNIGIKSATGSVIIRMDAHSEYPTDYVYSLVKGLDEYNADNSGGVWVTTPSNSSLISRSIAYCSSHVFGVGDAKYRVGQKTPVYVDTVPFGCFRKDLFDKIGFFDEDLIRNQDDELNARIIKSGGRIILLPDVKIKYFARPTYSKLTKMFYQYGLFKPLVNKKLKKPATVRQFIPLFFVLYLILLFLFSLFQRDFTFPYLFIPLILYSLLNLIVSFKIAKSNKQLNLLPYNFLTFFLIHLSYGFGYLKGIFIFFILNKNKLQLTLSR